MAIPVRPKFYFVKDGDINIFWLQPWKSFNLTEEQLGILASVIKHSFAVDDFEGAKLSLLDTSAETQRGPRTPKRFDFNDLPLLDDRKLKEAFDRFAAAYDIFQTIRAPKRETRVVNEMSPQDDFFLKKP